MSFYSFDPEADNINKVKHEINETKQIMVKNIDKMLERGDKIEILVEKTAELNTTTESFRNQAKIVKKKEQRKHWKLCCIIIFVFLAVAYLVAALICGPTLESCIKYKL